MTHLSKAPRKPLFNKKQGEVFNLYLDDTTSKKIAQYIFVDGLTNEEVAQITGYCTRQIERIRIMLMKNVLKCLIEKQIPRKPLDYNCPNCQSLLYIDDAKHCENCGQALDWSD